MLIWVRVVVPVMGTLARACWCEAPGAGEVGLRLLEGDLVVLGVDLGDELAGLDLLVVVDVDLDDLAGDARADLVEVAVDLGVVGVFGEGGAPVEEGADDDQENDDGDDDELAPRFLAGGLGIVTFGLALVVFSTIFLLLVAGSFAAVLRLICTVPVICAVWVPPRRPAAGLVDPGLPRLLSSEIIFVVGLGDAEGTGQRELGDVVLVERADVLVVGLLGLSLRLRDGQVVGDAGAKALLGFGERFAGEIDVRVGGVDELCGGLDVEEASRTSWLTC